MYTCIIILLLIYQPLLETILSIHYVEFSNIPITLFYYIVPIHYLISLQYFGCQRKKRIYESLNMEFLEKKKTKLLIVCHQKEIYLKQLQWHLIL